MTVDLEMEQILSIFFQESAEGLDAMESGLLALDASSDRETINTIFRAAHSIKGGAATFGFLEISGFTHAVETLLDQMRDGSRSATSEAVQLLLQAVDVMREMVSLARSKQSIVAPQAEPLTRQLSALLGRPAAKGEPQSGLAPQSGVAPQSGLAPADPAPVAGPDAPIAAADAGVSGWRIEFRPHPSLFATCNDPLRLFRELSAFGELEVQAATEGLPALAGMDPTQCYLHWTLILHASVARAQLAEVFDWVDANSIIVYEPLRSAVPAPASEPRVESAPAAPRAEASSSSAMPSPSAIPSSPAMPRPSKAAADAGSIRVATEKVDALINLVGELVITQSMLSRFSDQYDPSSVEALRRGLAQLSRNTRELQESVLKIRMLPISFSFNRFPRLVHELSRTLGKKVELRLSGENTEIDKTVLEKIGDPLVHLVRNALDHGLETPEARAATGKGDTGLLELNAFHEGGSVIIEVKDDGAGLNKERILAKAQERGLADPAAALTDEQIYDLIFLPGFSTAETLSDVSGRGVGMDVVRRNINDLGGHVHISSRAGQGSTVRIRLPLTLAILEGQMLRVGREIYVISLISIIETVQPRGKHTHTIPGGTEVFKHRDTYLPLVRLHDLFDIEPDESEIDGGLLVVVESDGKRVAILVDELLAQQQVVIKSLDTNFRQIPGLAGATIHGDGTVALILDVPGLIGLYMGKHAPQLAA
ncbi:MAG TPA: chemotaxis protein CheA [Steroidobacteraceae bacterium]|nr:chemotaxis protein CheA [Steroidobacteraceae bacterium]